MSWTAENLPDELVALLDERADQIRDCTGFALNLIADVLNRYDTISPRCVHTSLISDFAGVRRCRSCWSLVEVRVKR